MNSLFSLENEIALITGGGTGLGLGIARCFVNSGARVIIVGRRECVLEEACHELGHAASYRVHNITQREKTQELVKWIETEVGPISILVNNAGNHLKKAATETSSEEFQEVLDTHVLAAHDLSRSVLPKMIARRHGSILFIASMTCFIGQPLNIAYSASKSACMGMVRTLTAEVSHAGVRVNAIAPGWIDTPMLRQVIERDEPRRRRILERTPMCRMGSTADVGWAAVYLSSPAASFITGTVIPVDGGAIIGF